MEIPETINTQTLVKDLAKEIRLVEVNGIITESLAFSYFLNACVYRNITIIFLVLLTKRYSYPLIGHLPAKHWPHWTSVSWFATL